MNLAFTNLSFSVGPKLFSQGDNNLLSNVSGDFRPGELTGIMVPKNSKPCILMDILAGFTSSGVTGDIQIDGRQHDIRKFRSSSVYITKENHLPPKLTVQEMMHIAANLKFRTSNVDKLQVIKTILKELNLKSLRKTYTKDLSSGQKKQLIIALELMSNPPIMFFEKPTSGLDITAAYQILGQLKSLAREGRTIVCTIEQPSTKIWETFDHAYVIGNGCCIYAGSPRNLVSYLDDLDLRCPPYHNPADYLLEFIDNDHIEKLVASSENGKSERWRFARNTDQTNELQRIDIASKLAPFVNTIECMCCFYKYKHIGTLIEYNLMKLSRDKVLTYLRLSVNLFMALTIGLLFYGIGQDAVHISTNFKLLFVTQTFLIFNSFYTALVTFPLELPILRREYSNQWYKIHSFYLANRLADLPVQIIATAIYVLTIYFLTKQPLELERIRLFLISCVLVSLVGQTFGVIVGINFDSQTATTIGPSAIMFSIILSGFFIRIHHAHSYLQWIFNLSFCKYGFEESIATIYGLATINHNDFSLELRVPMKIASEFGVERLNYWHSALTLIGFYITLHLIAYICLYLRIRRR